MPKNKSLELRKIAFVAMPFGTKPTSLPPGKGPAVVDFDALWKQGIFPALEELDYLPIRADEQVGSIIIKDMLEQLVYADLVLADISIPSANVYYEAGVRHAAQARGCILICAEWAAPVFDLSQITQLRYPFPTAGPTDADYRDIADCLVDGIPALSGSEGPVYALTQISDRDVSDTKHLKEISTVLFDFQTDLRAATLKAADGIKAPLRSFLDRDNLGQFPNYALVELVDAFRDKLNWGELKALIDRLPDNVSEEPFFREQRALAVGKQGNLHEAVAVLENVAEKFGDTPERLGTIGGRYRELARDEGNREKKRRHLKKAIDAYRRGMQLDLNQYYCGHKLLVALVERGRRGDADEAKEYAAGVLAACERALELEHSDRWLNSALLVHAFFSQDSKRAAELAETILDEGWANWKLVSLALDLDSLLRNMDGEANEALQETLDEIRASLPVTQKDLLERLLPIINDEGGHYRKSQQVHARPAVEGEIIVSVTADGEETSKMATAGEMVIKNLTVAREEYLVSQTTFEDRYTSTEKVDDSWTLYDPLGEIRAIEITREVTELLNVGDEFFIMASWGSEQAAREGDFFVAPLPKLNEVYRIARAEFEQTYKLAQ
jgi:tetratricopeptide (TPR) repeat protein